jgi:hypothetical protein
MPTYCLPRRSGTILLIAKYDFNIEVSYGIFLFNRYFLLNKFDSATLHAKIKNDLRLHHEVAGSSGKQNR